MVTPAWPLLANELWWFLHSEQSGLLQVDSVVGSLGLSGALLGELVAARQVFIHDGRLMIDAYAEETVLRHYSPGSRNDWWPDRSGRAALPDTAATLLPQIVAEPTPLPVVDWLAYLSRDAYERVAEWMLTTGLVNAARAGRFRRRTAYPPKNLNVSGWAQARLRIGLERGYGFSPDDQLLIGLCQATGVHRRDRRRRAVRPAHIGRARRRVSEQRCGGLRIPR